MPGARILLVDDEEDIRDIARLLLENAGFTVGTAEDGAHALKQIEGGEYDLVITDMLMPGMDGVELINELRRRKPGLKVLAMSGGGHIPKEHYLRIARLCGAQAVLPKPFGREDLLQAIADCGVMIPVKLSP